MPYGIMILSILILVATENFLPCLLRHRFDVYICSLKQLIICGINFLIIILNSYLAEQLYSFLCIMLFNQVESDSEWAKT